jgi:hypothetical protein
LHRIPKRPLQYLHRIPKRPLQYLYRIPKRSLQYLHRIPKRPLQYLYRIPKRPLQYLHWIPKRSLKYLYRIPKRSLQYLYRIPKCPPECSLTTLGIKSEELWGVLQMVEMREPEWLQGEGLHTNQPITHWLMGDNWPQSETWDETCHDVSLKRRSWMN